MERYLLVIIDDEQDILDLLRYNFVRKGFEVETFESAHTAWNFISQKRPDVILCDWMMPGMNGLDFCKKIKADHALSSIPFIMVTCKNERSAINQAYAAGVAEYVVKPVKLLDLISKVKDLLSQRSSQSAQA